MLVTKLLGLATSDSLGFGILDALLDMTQAADTIGGGSRLPALGLEATVFCESKKLSYHCGHPGVPIDLNREQ